MHQWTAETGELDTWLDLHDGPGATFLDTEFMRTNTFFSRLALVQINVGGEIVLLDAPRLGAAPRLAARLRDARRACVMHSASEDLEALSGIVPDGPAFLFDTQIAAAMVGLGFGLSYQKLVAQLLGIDLPKAETRSDWMQRPLSAAQLEYAAQDVLHLPALHEILGAKLVELGRDAWLAEDCRSLVARICNAPLDVQPQRSFRGASDWPRERQAILRRLLLWRDRRARSLDKPRPWILDDAHALSLAQQPPVDATELFERCKGLRALRGPQRVELLDLLQQPVISEELDIAPIPPPLTTTQKRTLSAMRDTVHAVAERLDLPDGLLCPRKHLEALVSEHTWPVALEGWRKPLLHDHLMAQLGD
ncbi:MAG TPA: HRDC domain-containing protein [Rudaea sp.]|nr:HRDC domain-containing protein [Rudaea sp.]